MQKPIYGQDKWNFHADRTRRDRRRMGNFDHGGGADRKVQIYQYEICYNLRTLYSAVSPTIYQQ
ncbi:hypothetical protein EWB00_000037 [Schistosoma japonicum]|uniref:Uncharacterized protein n=1 Tax=Schistosoma japonicum TaxID=6182 RepID=A0A4Z2CKJ0_SCHJA|nr:hypothetical protein EWB00_000037 [Schistosoma japonicum]